MRWKALFRRKQAENDLEDEINSHLAIEIRQRMERGESSADARANARKDLGNIPLIKDSARDVWGCRLTDEIRQDLSYTARLLRRSPISTVVIVLTIALGIGANIAAYNVVYHVLLQPLPFRDPARLMQVWQTHPAFPQTPASMPDYRDWQSQARGFEQLSAYTFQAMNQFTMKQPGDPEVVQGTMVTFNLFSTLGIQPLLGRSLTAEDEQENQKVVLISEHLWRRKFASDHKAIGQSVRFETGTFTVIGVIPQEQLFPPWADVWMPISLLEAELENRRKYHPLEVVGRLKAGISESQALTEIQTIARQAAQAFPETNENFGAYVLPLSRQLTEAVRPALLLVWAAVGLVLLITCANVAHLLMGQMLKRRHEMNIRSALGANRARLVRQVVLESLVLAISGGAGGLVIAIWLTQILQRLTADAVPRMQWSAVPSPVWMFSAFLCLFSGLLFAVPSCCQVLTLYGRNDSAQSDGRVATRQRTRVGSVLVFAQVALAFLVLVGAALLLRSFKALLDEQPGFNSQDIAAIEVPSGRLPWSKAHAFFDSQLIPAVRALPGVVATAAANSAPMSLGPTEHSRFATRFGIEGMTFPDGQYPVANIRWVTPDYFRTLDIPLKRGRWLNEDDRDKPRCLINEAMARQFFSDVDPTTRHLIGGVLDPVKTSWEIEGVVGDVREMGLDAGVMPAFYFVETGPVMTLLIKTATKPEWLLASIEQTIRQADPQIAVKKAFTLQQSVDESVSRRRLTLVILGIFAALAAFLTAAGVYGVLTCSVNARRREFGIRIAVGATRRNIVTMVLREAMSSVMPGIAVGVSLHFVFVRIMKSLIYQVSPVDPASMAAAALCLCGAVVVSAWIPARRASTVDPGESLRVV